MMDRVRISGIFSLGPAAALAACASGPRLEASWYLVYEPSAAETYSYVDPNPLYPVAPELPPTQTAPPAPAPVKGEAAGTIYISIRNLRRTTALGRVLLSADGQPIQRSDYAGKPYILRPGEVVVLPLESSATGSSRACLIPTRLTIEPVPPRRKTRRLRVAGGLPESLPQEWIEKCDGDPSTPP
jgi:hypothetical protein